jgi:hypothetical protein
METTTSILECVNDYGYRDCRGTVEYRSVPGGNAYPRCVAHFDARLRQYENSIERYANSDVAPSWFDPTIAGERWDDDY